MPAQIERDKVSAIFSKGVLTITLPKTAVGREGTKKVEARAGWSAFLYEARELRITGSGRTERSGPLRLSPCH